LLEADVFKALVQKPASFESKKKKILTFAQHKLDGYLTDKAGGILEGRVRTA
jgi:hypothetical protein